MDDKPKTFWQSFRKNTNHQWFGGTLAGVTILIIVCGFDWVKDTYGKPVAVTCSVILFVLAMMVWGISFAVSRWRDNRATEQNLQLMIRMKEKQNEDQGLSHSLSGEHSQPRSKSGSSQPITYTLGGKPVTKDGSTSPPPIVSSGIYPGARRQDPPTFLTK